MLINTLPSYQAEHTLKVAKRIGETDVSPFGAFAQAERVCLEITFDSRAGAYAFTAEFTCDDDGKFFTLPFSRAQDAETQERYTLFLPTEKQGLYFYEIRYRDASGAQKVKNPIDDSCSFQLTVYDRDYCAPEWLAGGTMYQIFVDRFLRGGNEPPKPYAKMASDPHETPQYAAAPGAPLANDQFFGGDLYGVINKLDYFKKLGVTCLYLNPIFDAHTNHKYDTGDYMSVDSMFGGDAALDHLLTRAKEKGIKVILDGVFNHTGDDSLYFNKYGTYDTVGAYQSPNSPYADWYTFESYPDKYKSWWGISLLPTVNKDSPTLREYLFGENGVIAHYLHKGIAGWRLDVADELPEEFLVPLTARAKAENPDAIIIGEIWEDASVKVAYSRRRKYLRGHELDSVMNYPWRSAVINFIKHGDGKAFRRSVLTLYDHYPKCVCDNLMNFLGTHDTARILTVLGGEEPEGHTNAELANMRMTYEQRVYALRAIRCAYTLTATLPGVPCIYYGDEAGMEGYGDPFNRRFYPWGEEDKDLVSFFCTIGKIRRTQPAFTHGLIRFVEAEKDYVVYTRDEILIAVNRGDTEITLRMEKAYRDLLTDKPFTGSLPPLTAVICVAL